jgi:flagellar hook-length control protein FliK
MSHIRQNDDAMTASVPSPVASTLPLPKAPPSPSPQQNQGDDRFDSQLDAARRQQQPAQDDDRQTSDNGTPVAQGKTASTGGDKKTTHATDDKSLDDSDDTSLASTMLQLLGQSAPPADPSPATTQGTAADLAATSTPPVGMSALALAMPQAMPAIDAQAAKDPAATNAQAKLAGIPTSVLPTMPKLADLGKAGAADSKADDKAGDDDWHHVIANATNKADTAAAAPATVAKAVQTVEATPTDLPPTATHKDNDITAMLGLSSGSGGITHTAQPQVLQMQSSVDSGGFAQELGQQVAWMGGQDIKEARIRLNPEALGELEVKVSVDHSNNRVDVAFAAQHPAAVTAVQQTLGQLDTMLAGHGLSLGHTFVGQQQNQGAGGSSSSSGKGSFAGDDGTDGDVEVSPIRQVAVGLVDMFA